MSSETRAETRHDPTDVLIIGAGASGATAAKVLTESGLRVVALEKGPWLTKETFSGDELASINRYDLWPDPLLNPRTHRNGADQPVTTQFLLVWLTELPADDGGYRGQVAEVVVRS